MTSTALAIATPPTTVAVTFDSTYRRQLEPSNMAECFDLAALVARTGMFGVKTPESAVVRIMTGRSLGLSAMHSLISVYDVDGRPALAAKLKHGLCLASPHCEYFYCKETTDERATFVCKRKGVTEEQTITYTLAQATEAGLVKPNGNWIKHRAFMLRARASGALADVAFPDVTLGIATLEEAVEDERIEVVSVDGELTTAVAPKVDPVLAQKQAVPQAPARDFAKEKADFLKKIEDTKADTKARAELRKEIAAWDAPPPFAKDVRAAFTKAGATAETAAPPAVTQAPAPAPAPTGEVDRGDNADNY
jgi:hypothetical protein